MGLIAAYRLDIGADARVANGKLQMAMANGKWQWQMDSFFKLPEARNHVAGAWQKSTFGSINTSTYKNLI